MEQTRPKTRHQNTAKSDTFGWKPISTTLTARPVWEGKCCVNNGVLEHCPPKACETRTPIEIEWYSDVDGNIDATIDVEIDANVDDGVDVGTVNATIDVGVDANVDDFDVASVDSAIDVDVDANEAGEKEEGG